MQAIDTAQANDMLDLGEGDIGDGAVDVGVVWGQLEVCPDGAGKVVCLEQSEGLRAGGGVRDAGGWIKGRGADAGRWARVWALFGHWLWEGGRKRVAQVEEEEVLTALRTTVNEVVK